MGARICQDPPNCTRRMCVFYFMYILSRSFSVFGETEVKYKIYNERFEISLGKNFLPVKEILNE